MAVDTQKLKRLAELFSPYATLYAVGGCVRDELLRFDCYDVDVCSQLTVEEVKTALLNSDFVVSDRNLRMGTVHISCGKFFVEYTTFRTDSYLIGSGKHTPEEVVFTKDIMLDAMRRDFKCNALYKDIATGKIVDPLGGIKDVEDKKISTADLPEVVFEADGLRILRMVRFACELGFEIEEETFATAKRNAWRVKDISVERIREELNKIFVADTKHAGLKNAHVRGLRLLDELGLIDLLLPELARLRGLEQPKKYHLYDAYEHSVKAFEVAEPRIRWSALLHDVGKAEAVERYGNMHGHDEIGEKIVKDICGRFKFSNEETRRICALVRLHMVDLDGKTSHNKLRRFVAKNMTYIDDLCLLMRADAFASSGEQKTDVRIERIAQELKEDGTPLSVKELKVNGRDIVELGIEEKYRGVVLTALWEDTVLNPALNDRSKALAYVERKYKSLKEEESK